jgi:uncharacterized protein YukE
LAEITSNEKYASLILLRSRDGIRTVSEEEIIGYIMGYAEEHRKKPGFFKRRGERISLVTIIHYPIIVKNYREKLVLLIDPRSDSKLELQYYIPDQKILEELIKKLGDAKGKDFLDLLVRTNSVLEEIVSKKNHVYRKEYVLEKIISDPVIVKDLKTFIDHSLHSEIPGVKLSIGIESSSIDETIKRINEILDETHGVIKFLEEYMKNIEQAMDKWKEEIEIEYSERVKDVEEEIERVKEEVRKAIEELNKRREEEIRTVKERYGSVIETIKRRISETENEIKRLEEEIRKAKQYGREDLELKNKLNNLKRELKELYKELEETERKFKTEIEGVEKRYKDLIDSENAKVKRLIDRRESIYEELRSIEGEARNRYDSIRRLLTSYRDEILGVHKKILSISIPSPMYGEGVYYIPIVLIKYVKNGNVRNEYLTPLLFEYTRRLLAKYRVTSLDSLNKYLVEKIEKIISDPSIAPQLEENSLFRIFTLERIEIGLRRLADLGIVSGKDIKKIVKSLKEQIELAVK